MRTTKTAIRVWNTVTRTLIFGLSGAIALAALPAQAQRVSLTDIDAKIDRVQSSADGLEAAIGAVQESVNDVQGTTNSVKKDSLSLTREAEGLRSTVSTIRSAVEVVGTTVIGLGPLIADVKASAEDTNDVVKEGPTRISACGTISQSGSYVLVSNLFSFSIGNCLVVTANDVTIDMAGFLIDCGGAGRGIFDNVTQRKAIAVRNGTVTGCNTGISLSFTLGAVVERIRAVENIGSGIFAGNIAIVSGNIALQNGSTGIAAGLVSTVAGNTAFANGGTGISVSSGSTVTGNTASTNGSHGVSVNCPANVIGNTATENALLANNLNLSGGASTCNLSNNLAP